MNLKKIEEQLKIPHNFTGERKTIPVALDSVDALAASNDPHEFSKAKLNPLLEEYLFESMSKLPEYTPVAIHIKFKQRTEGDEEAAKAILAENFSHILASEWSLKKKEMHHWRINLCIGIFILALCLVINQLLTALSITSSIGKFIEESCVILGWVALWEPASYFLYGWRDGDGKIKDTIRLKNAQVIVE